MTDEELTARLDMLHARSTAALMLCRVVIRTHPDPQAVLADAPLIAMVQELKGTFEPVSDEALAEIARLFDAIVSEIRPESGWPKGHS